MSPANTAQLLLLHVFLLFYKIIRIDNPWFQVMIGPDQVSESGTRPFETAQPQIWDVSSRAVQGVNNWNLYRNDGDVICTAGTSHESQRKIRNNTAVSTNTHRLAGSFTSRNHCGSLLLSATCLQMSPSSSASPHEQPQNTEATKRVIRKSLPNTFETSQGLDPSGEKLRNKINSFCQESQDSGRKLPVPVVATEEKAVSLGQTVKSDSIFASPPRRLPSLLNVSDNSVCPSWGSGPKLPLWTVSGCAEAAPLCETTELDFSSYMWQGRIISLLQRSPIFFFDLALQQSSVVSR